MPFTIDQLDFILSSKVIATNKNKSTITHVVNTGPGLCSTQDAFAGNSPFIQQEFKVSKNEKLNVIIGDIRLKECDIQEFDIDFIHELLKYCNVYLWPGEKEKLSQISPIYSSQEFWKKRSLIVPATKKQIIQILSRQNLSSNNSECVSGFETKSWIKLTPKLSHNSCFL